MRTKISLFKSAEHMGVPALLTLYALLACTICKASEQNNHYTHRLELGLGIVQLGSPVSQTQLGISGEYEYRWDSYLGAGFLGNYIFSTPGIAILGIPFFVHPLQGDWFVGAAPIVEIPGNQSTEFGVRLETQAPIPLGIVTLLPAVAVDFLGNGQTNLIFALGLRI